jgi:hypothetical protein
MPEPRLYLVTVKSTAVIVAEDRAGAMRHAREVADAMRERGSVAQPYVMSVLGIAEVPAALRDVVPDGAWDLPGASDDDPPTVRELLARDGAR